MDQLVLYSRKTGQVLNVVRANKNHDPTGLFRGMDRAVSQHASSADLGLLRVPSRITKFHRVVERAGFMSVDTDGKSSLLVPKLKQEVEAQRANDRVLDIAKDSITIVRPFSGKAYCLNIALQSMADLRLPNDLDVRWLIFDDTHDVDMSRQLRAFAVHLQNVQYVQSDLVNDVVDAASKVRRIASIYARVFPYVTTEYVLLWEDDVVVPDDALLRLVDAISSGSEIALAGAVVYERHHLFPMAWTFGSNQVVPVEPFSGERQVDAVSFSFSLLQTGALQYTNVRPVVRWSVPLSAQDIAFCSDLKAASKVVVACWIVGLQHIRSALSAIETAEGGSKIVAVPIPDVSTGVARGMLEKKVAVSEPSLISHVKVSVIVACKNYAQFLLKCLYSIYRQSRPPDEVIFVDGGSTDAAPLICDHFVRKYGMRYYQGEYECFCEARNYGFEKSAGDYLVFMDGDNYLASDYIERCLACMVDPGVAIAYPRIHFFGEQERDFDPEDYNHYTLRVANYIENAAMVRRLAFQSAGAWHSQSEGFADWNLWLRITSIGWEATKANTTIYYREHSLSQSKKYGNEQLKKATKRESQTLAIVTPFSGKQLYCFDEYANTLRRLQVPWERTDVVFYDGTMGELRPQLLELLSNLPCRSVQYLQPSKRVSWYTYESVTPWDSSSPDIAIQLYRVYNELLSSTNADLVLTLEEDVAAPSSAFVRLLDAMDEDVYAVAAHYMCKNFRKSLAFRLTSEQPFEFEWVESKQGVERVDMVPLGCTLFKAIVFKHLFVRPFVERPSFRPGCDVVLGYDMKRLGMQCAVDWDVKCKHYTGKDQFLLPQ